MHGSGRSGAVIAAAMAIAALLAGCGGGNRLISNEDGLVASGELVLDSIPVPEGSDEYVIGPGDILDIVFPFNKDFTVTSIRVRPDGRISLPYSGEMVAAGLTPARLDEVITKSYATVLVDPQLTVIVQQYVAQLVYVLGEVETPGGFPYVPGMTLMAALAQGRGPTPRGAANSVLVIRRVAPDRIVGIQVDVGDIGGGKRFDLDVPLRAGDIVYVPRSSLAKAQDFALIVYDILSKPADLYLKGWQVSNAKVMYDYYRRIGQF